MTSHYNQPQMMAQNQAQMMGQSQSQSMISQPMPTSPPTLIGEIHRAAKISYCPSIQYSSLLCLGTMASTIDDSFETKCSLEIYDIAATNQSTNQPALLGSLTTRDTFHSVAWGVKGISEGTYSHGIIAGGMSDGTVNLWNAGSIISQPHFVSPPQSATSSPNMPGANSPLIVRADGHHKGAVSALQFHPSQPNLLASGAADGQLLVWDLANAREPKATKPNPSTGIEHPITCIGWNRKVQHILAMSNDVGETTVWDLRQKKAIVKFRSSARTQVRTTGLVWNPEASVQLAVSYANYPVCEIWDLRQSMTPKVKLEGFHTGSVLGLDWNPHDPHILLTAGEDQRMGVWDPLDGHLLQEYAPGLTSNIYDVTWSPHSKGVFATCSYDQQSRVTVQSLPASGTHVPSWLQRPSGGSLAFGGKLARVNQLAAQPKPTGEVNGQASPAPPVSTSVSVTTLSLEPQLVSLAHEFLQVLQQGDFVNYCEQKRATSTNEEDATIWSYMKILYEDVANQRLLLLKMLGFNPPPHSESSQSVNGTTNGIVAQDHSVNPTHAAVAHHEISEDSFFDTFNDSQASMNGLSLDEEKVADPASNSTMTSPAPPAAASAAKNSTKAKPISDEYAYTSFTQQDDDEAFIRHALLYGEFGAAVDKCLATGRLADAIVFSSFGAPELWERTRAAYFASHPHPFIREAMRLVSTGNVEDLVHNASITGDAWKQTLAVVITYTNGDRYRTLVNELGSRLETSGQTLPALICYMCCSNVDKAVELFSRPRVTMPSIDPVIQLHTAMEKIAVFAQATQAHTLQPRSQMLALKYSEYATLLAAQGVFNEAWNYLLASNPAGGDPSIAELLDRLYTASYTTPDPIQQNPPPFPFNQIRVDPDLALVNANTAYEQHKRNRDMMVQQTLVHHQQPSVGGPQIGQPLVQPMNQPMAQPNMMQQPQMQQPQMQQPQMQQQQQPAPYGRQQFPPQNAQRPMDPSRRPPMPAQVQPGYPPQAAAPFGAQPPPQAYGAPMPQQPQQPQYPGQPPMPGAPQMPVQQSPYQQRDPRMMQQGGQYGMPQPSTSQPPQHGAYGQQPHMPAPSMQPSMPSMPQQPQMPAARGPSYSQPQPPAPYGQQPPMQQPMHPNQPPMPQHSMPHTQPPMPHPSQQQQQQQYPGQPHMPNTSAAPQPPRPQQPIGQPMFPNQPAPQQQPQMPSPHGSQPMSHQQQPFQSAGHPSMPQRSPAQPTMPTHQSPMASHQPMPSQQPSMPAANNFGSASQAYGAAAAHQAVPSTPQPAPSQHNRIYNPAASQTPGPAPASHMPPVVHAPTAANFDPSSYQISPEFQGVVATLESMVSQLRMRVTGVEARKLGDQHARLGALYGKLSPASAPSLSHSLTSSLQALTACVSHGDYQTAVKTHHMALVKNDWTGNNDWILALKTLIEMAKKHLGQ